MTFRFVICPKSNFDRIKTELNLKFYHKEAIKIIFKSQIKVKYPFKNVYIWYES